MNTLIYIPFYVGALIGAVSSYFLSPVEALVLTVLLPVAVVKGLQYTGHLEVHELIEEVDPRYRTLARVQELGLDDRAAYAMYGQQLVNEMNTFIDSVAKKHAEAVEARDKFETIAKEMTK
jgi:hypothetical protein